jgi:ATP-dependent RNA helicase DHX36
VQSITGPLIIEGGRKRGRKVSRTGIEVVVEMPEQNIKVSGRGRNMVTAEIAASIRFKEEAEKYHAEQGTDTLIIKDFTTLNVDNARDFFAFYKNINSGVTVEVELTEQSALKSNGSSAFEGKVIVDGNEVGNSVIMSSKKKAEDLAFLSAAIELTRLDASLLPRFLKAPRSSSGEVLKSLNPVDMTVDEECILLMRDTLLNARRLGLRDEHEELGSEEEMTDTRRGRYRRNLAGLAAERRSLQLETAYAEYLQSPHLAELRKKREELPMNQYRAKVLDIVNNNTYSIIVGATGSGKTTQVPQILLEQAIQNGDGAACNIVCTQPRRIAATSVARRVADERAEKLQETVGYHVRFDAKLPVPGGSILYCTTGILLQQLQHSPDEVLDGTSHLIIDEVHERDMQIDFLLIILKKVMAQRLEAKKPTPKVVLMSATMNSELFASYFQNTNFENEVSHCPTLSVPGRTFPVKERYLEGILETLDKEYGEAKLRTMYTDNPTGEYFEAEKAFSKEHPTKNIPGQRLQVEEEEEEESIIDWKKKQVSTSDGEVVLSNEKEEGLVPNGLVATVIAHLAKTTTDGAMLVFLPGLDEMVKVDELLRTANILGVDFRDESKYKMHMLHSSISAGQNDVFNPVPNGCRKIILGTNIAETSITIPDVRYVIDTGKLREKRYDQIRRITKLQCTWISKSNSKQRAGRAGRVQDGHYYALFSKARFESLRAIGLPELLRSDLQETCLDIKAQAFKAPIREFLAAAIEPPPPQAVHAAVLNLQALDALTDQEKLTALGRLLASLPVHPALGKMIILGVVFRCLDPMLVLGAAAEERSMFLNPLHARREAQQSKESFTDGSGSDHIAMLNAFSHMRKLQRTAGSSALWEFSNKYFLHQGAFKSIDNTAKQIEEILVEARIIPYTPPHARANFQYGDPSLNQNSNKYHVIKALALAGFHPNLAVATSTRTFRTVGEKNAIVHPSSVNNTPKHKDTEGGRKFGTLFSYSTMARSNDGNNIFLRETSESTPLMATLFGGRLQNSPRNQRVLEMDDWLPFYVKSEDRRAVKTIIEFRKALERLLTGAFKDLSKEQSESGDSVKRFLAEDRVRECFAEGLVEVLNRDVRMSDRTVQRGWGGGNSGGVGSSNARRGGEERRPRIGLGRWVSAAQAKEPQQDKRYGSGFGWM